MVNSSEDDLNNKHSACLNLHFRECSGNHQLHERSEELWGGKQNGREGAEGKRQSEGVDKKGRR